MRRTSRTLPALLAATLAVSVGLAAQSTKSAQALLRTAMDTAVVDGDLRAAITQYQTIVETFEADRAVVAAALVQMGGLYEKLGDPEAREVYQRVVRDYADQRDAAQQAQARLAVANSNAQQVASPALHTELLWDNAHPQGDISPDGRFVTKTDWVDEGNLVVHNLATGEQRRLTHTANWCEPGCAQNSRISPDGERVLYNWGHELRLLPLDGDRTEPRTVWSLAEGSHARVQDWFPSGDRVVATVNNFPSNSYSIVTVSTVDGQVQQVLSIDWARNPQVRVSPDGRFLAYSRSASREDPERDIFLVAADGSSQTPLVQHAADDVVVGWSPGGTHLLFNSDRSGQPGPWALRVQNAAPAGEPKLLIANVDVGAGMGMTRDGTLHYAVRVNRRRVKIAEIDTKNGKLLSDPVNVTDRFVGSNDPGKFSPDGETLAYTSSRRGQLAIVIQSLKTGEERDLRGLWYSLRFLSWRPDGDRLFVRGGKDQSSVGLVEVDVATGQRRLFPDTRDMWGPTLTPDGTQILHRSSLEGLHSLYSYRVADGSTHVLPGGFEGGWFSLSPDGQWIATAGSVGTEIRLHPIAGGEFDVLLTTDAGHEFGRWPQWTPDGTALLVVKREDIRAELDGYHVSRLWVVPVDGADPVATELVCEACNYGPFMHPDGKRIVYAEGGSFYQLWAVHNLGLD